MLKETLLHQFQRYNRRLNLLEIGDKIVVAVSGGIDSVVLLDLLVKLQQEYQFELSVAHFNHSLRGSESDGDQQFVQQLAEQHHLPFYSENGSTKFIANEQKRSIQETARDLRYTFLNDLRIRLGYDKIVTAHNANDNAETVLFNLLRGTGVKGLCGIPTRREDMKIVRPLLCSAREHIQEYASEHDIQFREDSSNKKTDYSRNFLRHNVFPLLSESINSNVIETLNRNAELFSLLDTYLHDQYKKNTIKLVKERLVDQMVIDRELFLKEPEFIQYYTMYNMVREFSHDELSFDAVKEMIAIASAETGSWCPINEETKLYRDREHLVLLKNGKKASFQMPVALSNDIASEDFVFSSAYVQEPKFSSNRCIEYIDAQRLGHDLALRNWQSGDWFIPLGMTEKKKLSDFFIEQKVPVYKKNSIPILTSDGSIVWICGQRLDERFKVTRSTTSIIKLEYKQLHETIR